MGTRVLCMWMGGMWMSGAYARFGAVVLGLWFACVVCGDGLAQDSIDSTPNARQIDSNEHRTAIERGIGLLRKSVDNYPTHRQCFSCHHQAIPLFAFQMAASPSPRDRSPLLLGNDAERIEAILSLTRASFERDRNVLVAGQEVDGRGLTLGYGLWTFAIGRVPRDELIDAMIDNALSTQQEDGRWRIHSDRPPAASSDWMATALVAVGLKAYRDSHPRSDAIDDSLHKAMAWHLRHEPPTTTEETCGMLWLEYVRRAPIPKGDGPGYPRSARDPSWRKWLKANESDENITALLIHSKEYQRALGPETLWRLQNADGGWGQTPGRESDAYSTGMCLILASETSAYTKFGPFNDPRYRRGIDFLIKSQHADGSWHVSSRAIPVQEYFDNGDPHDTDQFISIMATGWATAALCNAWHRQQSPLSRRLRLSQHPDRPILESPTP